MKRKIYSELQNWKEYRSKKEALLVEGARRIGKSFIVEEFARNEYRSYILIDFSKLSNDQREIFDKYLNEKQLDTFFRLLSLEWNTKLYKDESLIIFDEVQLYPKARQAIKMLVADGRYNYIETGSLVSIKKNTKGILLPSEESHIDMYPMDFEEFLWAMGEEDLVDYIRDCFNDGTSLHSALHRRVLTHLRTYMIVGGMPQAILEWKESGDFDLVDKTKQTILNLYRNDIYQYAGEHAEKAVRIWDSIPGQLQKREKRFRIGALKKGARTREYKGAIFWLCEARIVNICYASTEPSVGLKLNEDDAKYKLYVADTGLLLTHAFSEDRSGLNELYKKLMLGKLEVNKGMLVENLVAQMLVATGRKLFFYAVSDDKSKENTMEIDFLIRKKNVTARHNISPIEVKSSQRYTLSSLNKFTKKYKQHLSTPYVLHSGERKIENDIVYLPLYQSHLV